MRLEEFAEMQEEEISLPPIPISRPPVIDLSIHFRGKNRSFICSQTGHNEEDCNVGWCDCPCHWWQDMEGQSEAMRSDI